MFAMVTHSPLRTDEPSKNKNKYNFFMKTNTRSKIAKLAKFLCITTSHSYFPFFLGFFYLKSLDIIMPTLVVLVVFGLAL